MAENNGNTVNNAPTTVGPAQNAQAREEQRLRGVSRSLLIAVGGTGHKVLLDVRQRLLQKYGSLDKLPIVGFLLIDTDQAIFGKNPNYSDAANLDNADKIHTSVHGVEQLRRNLREYPHLRDWLDPKTLSGDIQQGAGAVRARGRLSFFWNYDVIAKRIEEEIAEITKDSSKAIAIRNGLQVSEGITVYIVGSLLGGTGSGMFLDMAYAVKDLLKSQRMLETVGIFTIPPNSAAVAVDNRPNAYASLLELNHYTDPSTTFTAQYKPDQPGIENADPPFRYTYLVDTSSPSANLGSVDKLVEMIGHSIFLDLTSEFQRQKKSNRDNFDQFLTNPDDLGCPQNYLSMGLAAIHFPKDKVLHACASRLAHQILMRWTEPLSRVTNVGAFTEGELARLGLDPDEIRRQLTIASAETGDLLRDAAMQFWSGVNREYETNYPGHNRVVELLNTRQADLQAKYVDNDPNPDPLGKRRANLGEFIWQMVENLRAVIPAKEAALRSFISECVNDPNRRHGVARAFLDQCSERFRNYATALAADRDAAKETLVPLSEQRDGQLGEITRLAGDVVLGMVMGGAKRRSIDEKKDAYLRFARQWDTAFLDIRANDLAIYFYTGMQSVLDALKEEMDAYIERMRQLETFYRREENLAIENPVDVNGAILFDRGRRVESENGTATYVDGDIDRRYTAYVGDGMNPGNTTVNTTSSEILAEVGTAGNIYGLRDADINHIKSVVAARTRAVFRAVENESVIEKFFEKYGYGTDRSIEEMRRVFGLSQPFIHLQQNAPNYKHHQNKEQTIVGKIYGAQGRTESEQRFLAMLKDTVQGIRDGQISNSNEQHQVLFLRERAAFPLRLLEGMDSYRFAYEQARSQGASVNPIHTRKDVKEWVRIDPPSFVEQMESWETFCVGWASGVITEERDVKYTATGARETIHFLATYKDRFGMSKTDRLGTFVAITGDMARLMRESETPQQQEGRPPLEAREIILILCDNPGIRLHLNQGIENRLHELGVFEMGNTLVQHVNAQEKVLAAPIYRPYQKMISEYLEKINWNPNGPTVRAVAPVATAPAPVPVGTGANGKTSLAAPATAPAVAGPEPPPALPAPAPPGVKSVRERLADLKALFEDGLLDDEEFKQRKAEILKEI
ncbi:MAG: tubulin-like doman-containing protein [Capsulimonadales bacterium]|nr:tubulin-like doman-containing protein [Capsulimonadales bacterium]